ncbi:MAG TPA: helix-hairpin-helix domain-containing protein [Burkholderiaceae bacterium]|jgi:DNA polymerase/3'-5' exonuclease PolX
MPIHNADVAIVFNQFADLLEIKGENPFRICAYLRVPSHNWKGTHTCKAVNNNL